MFKEKPPKCLHKWALITDSYTESPVERLVKLGCTSIKEVHDGIFGTKIIILQCTVCGELNKTIEKV